MIRTTPRIISAVGTPLHDDDTLNRASLKVHLADQWTNGIDGVLIGGTMGYMQMLPEHTYRALIEEAARIGPEGGEVLVGIGDAATQRTLDRLAWVNQFQFDGVVVLTPYFVMLDDEELIAYFTRIAEQSRAPVFLYDLPALVGRGLSINVVQTLAAHPNVHGIKVSGRPAFARQVMDEVSEGFRTIVAEPLLLDTLVRGGVTEHVDGLYAVLPEWTMALVRAIEAEDLAAASRFQTRINTIAAFFHRFGPQRVITSLMNLRGVEGRFAPHPVRALCSTEQAEFENHPEVRRLIAEVTQSA